MENKSRKILTLCIVHNSFDDAQGKHPRVLLGMKKRGFGEGRWNGFGGKVEPGEEIEDAAKRELQEEAGVTTKDMTKLGILEFEFRGNPEILEVHVFKVLKIEGEPQESDEMRPEWFDIKDIPFEEMWPDDKHWFPLFFADKKFRGEFLFDEANSIIDMNLEEVEEV